MWKIIPIKDLNAPALDIYTRLNENQLRHYYEPRPAGLFIAESKAVIERALDAGYEPVSFLMEERYVATEGRHLLEKAGQRTAEVLPVYVSTIDVLSRLTGYHLNRGILGAFRRKDLPTVEEVCAGADRIVILDNVENPTNVGAIFRSAAALGMDAVLVTPSSADPLQRRAVRVGVGTVFQIPWTYIGEDLTPAHARAMGLSEKYAAGRKPGDADSSRTESKKDLRPAWPDRGMEELHRLGYQILALALRHDTVAIDDPGLRAMEKLAIILGNEGEGLPEHTLELCDLTAKIPMSHGVDSLNVAACSAVAFWQLRCER